MAILSGHQAPKFLQWFDEFCLKKLLFDWKITDSKQRFTELHQESGAFISPHSFRFVHKQDNLFAEI